MRGLPTLALVVFLVAASASPARSVDAGAAPIGAARADEIGLPGADDFTISLPEGWVALPEVPPSSDPTVATLATYFEPPVLNDDEPRLPVGFRACIRTVAATPTTMDLDIKYVRTP